MKWFLLLFWPGISLLVSAQEFNPTRVAPAFEAITNPETATSREAEKWVKDDELVLGVTIANQSRAYPINMLTNPTREIINDTLGGRSIAATW